MQRLKTAAAMLLATLVFGCSLAHIAWLPKDLGDTHELRAIIEGCLSSIGMRDKSHEQPYSSRLASEPHAVSIWNTPPPKSKRDLFLGNYKGAIALVRLFENQWSVYFFKHHESFPPAFSNCMGSSEHSVIIEIESEWYIDLS